MKQKYWLIGLFIAIFLAKAISALLIVTPTIFSDEYVYAKLARSIVLAKSYGIHEIPNNSYPPLYAILISPAYLLTDDMEKIYMLIKIINAIISTAIIFPVYFLAKELMSKEESRKIAGIIAMLPPFFAFAPFIMAENLFYPLGLTAIYFIYKAEQEKKRKWSMLAGISIGAAILTKVLGVVLIFLVLGLFLKNRIKKEAWREDLKNKALMGSITIIVLLPWIIRNIVLFGASLQSVLGSAYTSEIKNVIVQSFPLINIITWVVIYGAIICFASGIIFFWGVLRRISREKEEKERILTSMLWIFFIIVTTVAVNHNLHGEIKEETWLEITGRPIARYVDLVIPLIILIGYVGIKSTREKEVKSDRMLLVLLVALGSMLIFYPIIPTNALLPVNNMSLIGIGLIVMGLKKIGVMTLIQWLATYVLMIAIIGKVIGKVRKMTTDKILGCMAAFFILMSVLNIGAISYNSQKNWYPLEQIQLGKWIQKNIARDKAIVFDEEGCKKRSVEDAESICSPTKHTTLAGFWINNKIKIAGDPEEGDYFISRREFDYIKVHTTESNIYVYEVG